MLYSILIVPIESNVVFHYRYFESFYCALLNFINYLSSLYVYCILNIKGTKFVQTLTFDKITKSVNGLGFFLWKILFWQTFLGSIGNF